MPHYLGSRGNGRKIIIMNKKKKGGELVKMKK
jgi:hypothetical protein